ncbi:MAG: hypothetical protein ACOYK8_03810 [Alphaproteobacteria bacterium]
MFGLFNDLREWKESKKQEKLDLAWQQWCIEYKDQLPALEDEKGIYIVDSARRSATSFQAVGDTITSKANAFLSTLFSAFIVLTGALATNVGKTVKDSWFLPGAAAFVVLLLTIILLFLGCVRKTYISPSSGIDPRTSLDANFYNNDLVIYRLLELFQITRGIDEQIIINTRLEKCYQASILLILGGGLLITIFFFFIKP